MLLLDAVLILANLPMLGYFVSGTNSFKATKVQLFPRTIQKTALICLPNQKSCIFVAVLMAEIMPPTYRNTKRYARLVSVNVRNLLASEYSGSRIMRGLL
jgi:hypothetical protein